MKASQVPFIALFLVGCFIALSGTSALSTAGTEAHLDLSARTNIGTGISMPITAILYEGNGAAYGAMQGEYVDILADDAIIYTGITNEYGRFTHNFAFGTPGPHTISASWAGDESHPAVTTSVTVNILAAPSGDGDDVSAGFVESPVQLLIGSLMAAGGALGIWKGGKGGSA